MSSTYTSSRKKQHPHIAGRTRRGSAIFIVLLMLAMMTIMGMSYMQWSRASYEAAVNNSATPKVSTVAKAALGEVALLMSRDVVNSDDEFFNANPATGPGAEPYDYPFTNPDKTEARNQTSIFSLSNPSTTPIGVAYGGHLDDKWLASTVPDFSTVSAPTWPHLTNVNGMYVSLPILNGTSTAAKKPYEYPLDRAAGDSEKTDTNLAIDAFLAGRESTAYQPYGVDADGDGVRDARWTWASIPQIDGTSYVMAMRVIDLSALININGVTAMTTDGDTTFDSSAMPRGYYPTSVDLSRLLSRMQHSNWAAWPSTWPGELQDSMTVRGIAAANPPVLPLGITDLTVYPNPTTAASPSYSVNSQVSSWYDAFSHYGYTALRYGQSDGYPLRYKNGLNNSNLTTNLENLMPSVLRRDATGEVTYTDVSYDKIYSGVPGAPTDAQKRLAFFQGANTSFSSTTAVSSRVYPAVRHMLTDRSGAAVLAPNHNNMHSGARTLKYDLKFQDFNHATQLYDAAARISNIANLLVDIFSITSADGSNAYLGLTSADASTLQQIALEFSLAIQDYSDADSVPSQATLGGVTYYSLEMLPFLREAYFQVGYDNIDTDSNSQGDTFVFDAASCAAAIEIGNPFDRPIPAALLNNRIQIAVVQAGADVSTWTITGASDLPARDPAGADLIQDQLVIYSNPGSARDEPNGTSRNDLANPARGLDLTTGSPAVLRAADGTFTFAAGTNITVELRLDVGSGTFVTYDRLQVAGFQFPASVAHSPETPTPQDAHGQGSMVRAGQNIRYLSNTDKDSMDDPVIVGTQTVRLPDTNGYRNGAQSIDALGQDVKPGITGDTNMDSFQLPRPNRPIFSVAELGYIPMFGFTDQPGGDFVHRLTGGDGVTPLPTDRRFLDFSSGASLPDTVGISHAAMVMDQFTAVSPRYDNLDNDNDDGDLDLTTSVDDAGEQFVPGTININTAPLHLMTLASPMFESVDDVEALMKQIVAYRDNASGWRTSNVSASVRQTKGIASIGEIMSIVTGGAGANTNIQRYSSDSVSQAATGLDIYPMAEELGTAPYNAVQLAATDSAEEQMARFQSLAQLYSTRSDIFAVYLVVQGYPSADFRVGVTESIRVLAIFDRSGLTDSASAVRLVGYYELDY